LQEDPLPDVNLYSYCGDNPLNYTDPFGLRHGGVRRRIPGGTCSSGASKSFTLKNRLYNYAYLINTNLHLGFNAGAHVPVAPGVALGPNFTWSDDPSFDSVKNEAEFGAVFDFGISAGLDWSAGRNPGGTIGIGTGKYLGI